MGRQASPHTVFVVVVSVRAPRGQEQVGQRGYCTAEDAQEIIAIGKRKVRATAAIRFEDFEIIKPISAGAYGKVWLVQKKRER